MQSPVGPMGQFLYSVYVHSGPDYPGYKEQSLFYGREVPDRVQVGYLVSGSLSMFALHEDGLYSFRVSAECQGPPTRCLALLSHGMATCKLALCCADVETATRILSAASSGQAHAMLCR